MSSPVPSRYVGPERIYHGATADVYSALDRQLGRKVAIKILAPHVAKGEQLRSPLQWRSHGSRTSRRSPASTTSVNGGDVPTSRWSPSGAAAWPAGSSGGR